MKATTVQLNCLHSLDQSGGLDIYGKPMVDATKNGVIDEMNEGGGLLVVRLI